MQRRQRLRRPLILTSLVAALVLGSSAPLAAQAAQPPAGYPTGQVMANAQQPTLGTIPIRRGFWDSDAGQGFGMDKAWHYHNLPSLAAQKFVLQSPDHVLQGNGNWRMKAFSYKIRCENGANCQIEDEREVWGIYRPTNEPTYYGWPGGNPLGLQTMYCQQNGVIKCPSWVVLGLTQGASAALSGRSASEPQPTPAPEAGLPADLRAEQIEFYSEPEVQALLEAVEAGDVALIGSYTPIEDAGPFSLDDIPFTDQ